jgi:hypothetical protein
MMYPDFFFFFTINFGKESADIFRWRHLIQIVHHSLHVIFYDSIFEDMVKVKAVKTTKVVKAKAVRKNSSAAAAEAD